MERMTSREIQEKFKNSTIWKCWGNELDEATYVNSDTTVGVKFWSNDNKHFYLCISIANVYLENTISVEHCSFNEGFLKFKGFTLYLGYDPGEVAF